jgi:heptosyltransferase-1
MYAAGTTQANPGPRILVVRLGAMGDILHTLPAVATLKHSFPNSHLSWAVDAKWAVLLEGNAFLDERILLERYSVAGLLGMWKQLRASRFDWAVDFQGLFKSALLASVAHPERIFGFHQSQVRERIAALFYSNKLRAQSGKMIDRNLELAAATGAHSILRSFPLPEGTREGQLPADPFVLASPLAGWAGKQWPLEYYEVLAGRLREQFEMPLVLNGPPQAATVLRGVRDVQCHYSSVSGLIHATRQALAVVGIDSGPLHLAAALAKPGVAIYGPTDPERNGPYGTTVTVLRSPRAVTSYKRRAEIDPSMREISPETVFRALKTHIARQNSPAGCSA